jgi:hypothetical protein
MLVEESTKWRNTLSTVTDLRILVISSVIDDVDNGFQIEVGVSQTLALAAHERSNGTLLDAMAAEIQMAMPTTEKPPSTLHLASITKTTFNVRTLVEFECSCGGWEVAFCQLHTVFGVYMTPSPVNPC